MKRLERKPFALVGVNTNNSEANKLKEAIDKEKLNWRSFAGRGAISAEWNNPGTPSYYLIDSRGLIRYKWTGNPGEKALDAAIEKLIREAEATGGDTPK